MEFVGFKRMVIVYVSPNIAEKLAASLDRRRDGERKRAQSSVFHNFGAKMKRNKCEK
jgi:hypothetical protein